MNRIQKMWVDAVRYDPKVGRGSCSVIDECYTDPELVEAFVTEGVSSVEEALVWARQVHINDTLRTAEWLHFNCYQPKGA